MQTPGQVIYLDTNHLSFLGRNPSSLEGLAFLRALDASGAKVALSLVHLIELSHPNFRSSQSVAAFLDELPVVWALSPDDLWEAEVQRAYAALAGYTNVVMPFGLDVSTSLGGPPMGGLPSEAVSAFRDPELRAEVDRH